MDLLNPPSRLFHKRIIKKHKPDFVFVAESWMQYSKFPQNCLSNLHLKLFAMNHKINIFLVYGAFAINILILCWFLLTINKFLISLMIIIINMWSLSSMLLRITFTEERCGTIFNLLILTFLGASYATLMLSPTLLSTRVILNWLEFLWKIFSTGPTQITWFTCLPRATITHGLMV